MNYFSITLENITLEITSSNIQLVPPDPVNPVSEELRKELVVTGTVKFNQIPFSHYTKSFLLTDEELINYSLNGIDELALNRVTEFFKSK